MTSRLAPAPSTFVATRNALHAVAEWVLAPARHAGEGRIGLLVTPDGFGTPVLPDGRQLRIAGTDLVVESTGALTLTKLTTLADAALAAGVTPGTHTGVYEATTEWSPHRPLEIDSDAARCLADWFSFSDSLLEEVRAVVGDASDIQLWPEHFDLAMDVDGATTRVNVGASPGDAGHPLPYLYVGPWSVDDADPFWNEPFGSSLGYEELVASDDQLARALAFVRAGLDHA